MLICQYFFQATIKGKKGGIVLLEFDDKNCTDLASATYLNPIKCHDFGDSRIKVRCNKGQATFQVFNSKDCSGESSLYPAPPQKTCAADEIQGKITSYLYEC